MDNYFTGSKENIRHLIGNPHFELMRHDVTFPLYVEVGQIYNLACSASPIHYQFDLVQTTKTSVHCAINMLGLTKRLKARILQKRKRYASGWDGTVDEEEITMIQNSLNNRLRKRLRFETPSEVFHPTSPQI